MIRVGRFELDERHEGAASWLARVAWVPRGRREALATRVLSAMRSPPGRWCRLLGAPSPVVPGIPAPQDALQAARAVLGAPGLAAPLSLLPAPSAAAPRRMLFLFAGGAMISTAKVVAAADARPLRSEADALRAVAALGLRALAPLLPREPLLGESGGLAVLGVAALPGEPLLRRQRLAPALGAWPEAALAQLGRALGELHAATRAADGTSLLHGDAWSRNVLVDGDAASALVDWEAGRRGSAAGEAATFLLASARADVAGRARMPGAWPAAWPAGAHAFFEAWAREAGAASAAEARRLLRAAEPAS